MKRDCEMEVSLDHTVRALLQDHNSMMHTVIPFKASYSLQQNQFNACHGFESFMLLNHASMREDTRGRVSRETLSRTVEWI